MYLISTAKTTILTDFNDLETRSVYQHSNGENTDFQFYAQQRIFVEVNKKSGLEIMRIKEKSQSKEYCRDFIAKIIYIEILLQELIFSVYVSLPLTMCIAWPVPSNRWKKWLWV